MMTIKVSFAQALALKQENERLRAENERLRAALAAAETKPDRAMAKPDTTDDEMIRHMAEIIAHNLDVHVARAEKAIRYLLSRGMIKLEERTR